ncbi:MAG TPA: hypothetical protein VMD27_03540, partial [Candidatus Aquilonibacter sp.]|nr:hypothetical protein [Candidatus Aquilonibacter sp.]
SKVLWFIRGSSLTPRWSQRRLRLPLAVSHKFTLAIFRAVAQLWIVRPFMSEEQPTNSRVYTPWQVCVSCLIGGPAPATWLIAENFRVFDNQKKRKLTFLYGAIGFLALIGLGFVLPKHSSGTVLAALIAVATREITKHQQGSQIEDLRAKGGRIASWWSAVGIGVLGLVATLIVIVVLVLVLP